MPVDNLIAPLRRSTRKHGGKAVQLAWLLAHGFPVPDGLVLSSKAIQEFLKSSSQNGLTEAFNRALKALETDFVAVRSSALQEDGEIDSYAGIFDTQLNVEVSSQAVVRAIEGVVQSAESSRAVAYTASKVGEVSMAIIIQRMIHARVAGVAFTDAVAEDGETVILVEAAEGLGEAVVGGRVRPTRIMASQSEGQIDWRSMQVEGLPLLTPEESQSLLELTARVRVKAGEPRDIEWAVDQSGKVWLLQARPITKPVVVPVEVAGGSVGAAPGRVTAPTFVINNDDDLAQFPAGHVLVAEVTETDYLPAMQRAAAILTEEGGILSHAGIVAREIGIPCVVGRIGARRDFPTGTVVTIDGTSGDVLSGRETAARGINTYSDVEWGAAFIFDLIQERFHNGTVFLIDPTPLGTVVHFPPDLDPERETALEIHLRKQLGISPKRVTSEKFLWYFELKRFRRLPTFQKLFEEMLVAVESVGSSKLAKAYNHCHELAAIVGQLRREKPQSFRRLALGEIGASLHFLVNALIPEGYGLLAGYRRLTQFMDSEGLAFSELLARSPDMDLPIDVAQALQFIQFLSEERNRVFAVYCQLGAFSDDYFETRGEAIQTELGCLLSSDSDEADHLYAQHDFISTVEKLDEELYGLVNKDSW